MKRLILILTILLPATLLAADVPLAKAFTPESNTLLSATTNATGTAQACWANLYHTVHIVSPTNFGTVTLSRSLDNTNWVGWATNDLASAKAAVTEITAVGKWAYVKAVLSGMTNSGSFKVLYYGGR